MGISNYKVYTPLKYADIITELAIKNYFRSEYTEKKIRELKSSGSFMRNRKSSYCNACKTYRAF